MPYHKNTTIIKQTHDDKDAVINDAGRLLYKYIYLSLYCKGSKRVVQGFACERELETEEKLQYFDLHSLWPSRCVFLVLLMLNRSPGVHSAGCWLSLLHLISFFSGPQTPSGFPRAPSVGCGFPYHIFLQLSGTLLATPLAPWASNSTGTRTQFNWLVELNWVI